MRVVKSRSDASQGLGIHVMHDGNITWTTNDCVTEASHWWSAHDMNTCVCLTSQRPLRCCTSEVTITRSIRSPSRVRRRSSTSPSALHGACSPPAAKAWSVARTRSAASPASTPSRVANPNTGHQRQTGEPWIHGCRASGSLVRRRPSATIAAPRQPSRASRRRVGRPSTAAQARTTSRPDPERAEACLRQGPPAHFTMCTPRQRLNALFHSARSARVLR